MSARIEDVDADEHLDVPVLVQRYHIDNRVYEVFRKATASSDDDFEQRWGDVYRRVGAGELVEPWSISSWLTDPGQFDPEEELSEIFAMVYEDRGGLPGNEGEEDDYLCIEYHPEAGVYYVAVPEASHPTVEGVTAPTLDEALERGILLWDKALQEDRDEER